MEEVKLQFFGLNPIQKSYLISDLLIFTFSLIIFISQIYIFNYTGDIKDNGYIKDIISNWNFLPIVSFNTSNSNENELNQNNLYYWEGTIEGCDCQSASEVIPLEHRKINKFSCTKNQNYNNYCKQIAKINGKNINIYKGKNLIPIFSENKKKYLELIGRNNIQCEETFKKCGILDSKNNILCLPLNENCPVNKIIIDKNEIAPSDFNYTTLPLNDSFYFHFTNESINSSIIISLKLSEGNLCLNPERHNSMKKDYELYFSYDKCFCENEFDYRYNEIDSIEKQVLFNENGINDLVKTLPNFTVDGNLYLYSRNYIGLNNEFAIKNGNKNKLESFINSYNGFNITNLVLSICFMLCSFIILIWNLCKSYNEIKLNKYDYAMKIISLNIICFYVVLSFLILMIKGNSIEILNNIDNTSYYVTREIKWKITVYSNTLVFLIILSFLIIILFIYWFNAKKLSCWLINDSNKVYEMPSERVSRFPSKMVRESLMSNSKYSEQNDISQN